MDEYEGAMASVGRVMGLLNTPITIPHGVRAATPIEYRTLPLNTVQGEVQFDNITFAYNGIGLHLGFDAPSASVVCLTLRHAIGATNCGKAGGCLMRRERRRVYRGSYLQFANLSYQGGHLAGYGGEEVTIR